MEPKQIKRLILFLIIPVLFLVAVVFFPLLYVLIYSFWTIDPTTWFMTKDFSLKNYQEFFTSKIYAKTIWNAFKITGWATFFSLLIGYPVSYWIGFYVPSRFRTLCILLVVIPFWTSFLIRTYAWIGVLQNRGFLDFILMGIGFIQSPTGLLYSQTAVIIGFVHIFSPLMILPIYASIRNIDPNLLEAAKDLGATGFRVFLRVTLPLTTVGILVGILLFSIQTFGSFVTPLILGNIDSIMIGNVIADQFGEALNWPFGASLSIIVVFIVVIALLIFNRYIKLETIYRQS
jgi:spermidine/putrescine transport system permease protein